MEEQAVLRRAVRVPAFISAVGMLLFLSSCRSAPDPEDLAGRNILGWLPPDSDILISLYVPGNEELAGMLLGGAAPADAARLESVIERAELVAVGMDAGGEEPQVHLATIGAWPRNFMGGALGSEWSKVSRFHWKNTEGMEIAVPVKNELILSSGQADLMIERAQRGVEPAVVSSADSPVELPALELWIVNLAPFAEGDSLLGMMSDVGPSVESVNLVMQRNDDNSYALKMIVNPEDPAMAPAFSRGMRILMSLRFGLSPLPEERALLQDIGIAPEGGTVLMTIPAIGLDTIETLLAEMGMFAGEEA